MFNIPFRTALALCLGLAAQVAGAQTYPSKPINFITPATPGSTADVITRVIGEELGKQLGQPVVTVNRTGGSGLIAANATLAAPADGYTIYMSTPGTLVFNPHVLKSMPFDPATAFTPVALSATMPMVLVVNPKATNVTSLKGLIALGKKQQLTYGSPGAGSTPAIAAALFGKLAGLDLAHIGYQGFAPATMDLLAGRINLLVADYGYIRSHVVDGKVRPLAVTSAARAAAAPDIPTMKESGLDVDIPLWYGIFVRPGTPPDVLAKLENGLRAAMGTEVVKKRWADLGLESPGLYGKQFDAFYRNELRRWSEILPPLGIKID